MQRVIGGGLSDAQLKAKLTELYGSGLLNEVLEEVRHKEAKKPRRKRSESPKAAAKPDARKARAEVVKRVMHEKGLKMIEASRYVKEHGLYKAK